MLRQHTGRKCPVSMTKRERERRVMGKAERKVRMMRTRASLEMDLYEGSIPLQIGRAHV